ncbi:hypothetical protein [Candidatus Methylobacter oryzae]|uniref:DUF4398 domain-containing protein n=1 Tax=Candidatus Methylobacter oryzae TaxID=2497749 RepID=A0ABY3CC05_9GAMM|nr:hypothetical protein [Candidatus Methylobacter oryzae]TRW97047.1 hypothetical protein EKO24_008170 [Candidatus Methylobacter oryzae]
MNITKNTARTLLLAFCLGSACVNAYAEEPAKSSVHSPNEAMAHIEMAKTEIAKSDFMPPSEHLKKARMESEKVTGNPSIVKKANATLIQAQIKVNQNDIKGATTELNKTLELYKSLK